MKHIVLVLAFWFLAAVACGIFGAQLAYWLRAPGWVVGLVAFVCGVITFGFGMLMVAGGDENAER